MKKHIVLYVNSMKISGGIERVIATISNMLSKEYKVTILVRDEPNSFYPLPKDVNIETINFPLHLDMAKSRFSRIWEMLCNFVKIRKHLRPKFFEINPDYFYIVAPYACAEYYLSSLPKQKLIISEHGSRTNYNFIYRLIKSLLYKKYPVQIVPNDVDYNWYKKRGFPSVKIPHLRSNLPYKKWEGKNNKVILNVGRMTDDKQQLQLLSMWKKIVYEKNIYDWKLNIAGKGENHNAILNYVKENKLENYVEILAPIKNVEDYYNKATIFACYSRTEGYPMVLIEAISFGLPTISFDCPTGPAEIFSEGAGVIVPLNDEQKYIEELIKLMQNTELQEKYSDRAFQKSLNWQESEIIKMWQNIIK